MHKLLQCATESISKSDDKYNTVNKKLFDTQILLTALTKKVDELTEKKH